MIFNTIGIGQYTRHALLLMQQTKVGGSHEDR